MFEQQSKLFTIIFSRVLVLFELQFFPFCSDRGGATGQVLMTSLSQLKTGFRGRASPTPYYTTSIYSNSVSNKRPQNEALGNKPHKLCSYFPEPRAEV